MRAHAVYPTEAPVACELLVLEGERVRLRVPGRLITNGDRFGPFALHLPAAGSPSWHLRPSEELPPDELHYRRATGPIPPVPPPPEPP